MTDVPLWPVTVERRNRISDGPAKRVTPEELPAVLNGGETVVIGHGSGWPKRATTELVERSTASFRMVHNRIEEPLPYFSGSAPGRVRHDGFMLSRSTRGHFGSLDADYIPNTYVQTPRLFRARDIEVDVAVLHLSEPDVDGYCSLGTCSAYLPAAAEVAPVVVGQVNPAMPRTYGTRVHVDSLDYLVEVDDPLWSEDPQPPGEQVRRIAENVASLVDDGSTLQVGIGKLADAVLDAAEDRRGLRVYSETFGDAAIRLLEAGAMRQDHEGVPLTATFLTGTRDLYRAVEENPEVRVLPVDWTNDPRRLANERRLVAINSAIEVDLTGQVNAEAIGPRLYTGVGGHLDFAVAAGLSGDGRYVVAMPSAARGRSRIVGSLAEGTPVTIPRSLSHYVVTEHGVAKLKGKTLRQRAESLIEIAAPEHRAELAHALDSLPPAWGR